MKDVKLALTRKLGPLPAYAWAAVGGVGLYFYRRRGAAGGGSSVPAALAPLDSTGTGPRDPLVLEPGQRVYDPGTGRVSGDEPSPTDPGGGSGGGDPGAGNGGAGNGGGKPKHEPPKHAHPGHKIDRPRVKPKPHPGGRHAAPAKGHPARRPDRPAKSRTAKPAARNPAAPERGRAQSPARVALRQRPAAPRVVDHATQQTGPHPGAHPPAAAKAPVHPPAARPAPAHVKPAPKRRR